MTINNKMLMLSLSFLLVAENTWGSTGDSLNSMRAIEVVSERNCGLKMLIPATVESVDCGAHLHENEYTTLSIGYLLRQFEHNDFDRTIEGIIRKISLDDYFAKGAAGQLTPNDHDSAEPHRPHRYPALTQSSMREVCTKPNAAGQMRRIAGDNWSGYLWVRESRLKHADLGNLCMASDISEACFIAIIGNSSRILHFSPICLPRNGKKTYPSEFDFEDFLKMIHSIRFNTD